MGVFDPAARERLRRAPLEQLWRDHLLAGSLALDPGSGFAHATFAIVWPSENTVVGDAVEEYAACLIDRRGFSAWTLESVLAAFDSAGAGRWRDEVRGRSLGA